MLTVFMYHDIVDAGTLVEDSHRPYALTTEQFREQMRVLGAERIAGVRLDAHLDPETPIAGRSCVITFDDGHQSNYTHALPLLMKHGFTATFFVTTGWVGTAPYMDWSQVRKLSEAGMEIGSHSVTHRPPVQLTPAELERELVDSKKMLEDHLGHEITTASSPTGFFNAAMIPAARAAGYRGLCYGRIGLWRSGPGENPIPRIPIKPGDGAGQVLRLAHGDRLLVTSMRARQAVRNGLKKGLGVERYLKVRSFLLRASRPRS